MSAPDIAPFLPKDFRRVRPEGVRVMAPTGKIGFVPAEQLQAALQSGAKLIGMEEMLAIRQEVFMSHALFKDQRAVPDPKKRKRRSIIWKGSQ